MGAGDHCAQDLVGVARGAMRRSLLPIAVLIWCGGANCDALSPSPGTNMRFAEIPQKRLSLSFGTDCTKNAAGTCAGRFAMVLSYSGVADCVIFRANASVNQVPIPQTSSGGWDRCPIITPPEGSCQDDCRRISWEGDVSSVLPQLADSSTIVLTDGDGPIVFMVSEPSPMADIALRGIAPGAILKERQEVIADLIPTSSMSAADFQVDPQGNSLRQIRLTFVQDGRLLLTLLSTLALDPGQGPWAFSFSLFFPVEYVSQTRAGPATLGFELITSQLSFPACPGNTICVGDTNRMMLQFPIDYAPGIGGS